MLNFVQNSLHILIACETILEYFLWNNISIYDHLLRCSENILFKPSHRKPLFDVQKTKREKVALSQKAQGE